MFTIIGTETYIKELKKWPKQDQLVATKVHKELAISPNTGKPLNYKFLKEKKIGGRRIYYLIYDDLKLVLLVATSEKSDQQTTINHINKNLKEFRKIAEKITIQDV